MEVSRMTFTGPYRTIIVQPVELPSRPEREEPAAPVPEHEPPPERRPEPSEEPERVPAKSGRAGLA
jgi:hypothetical protein